MQESARITKPTIPVIDGSHYDATPEAAKKEAYDKLLAESDRINAILKDGVIVEEGQGLENIPEYVDEMGDSIAREIDFEGKKAQETTDIQENEEPVQEEASDEGRTVEREPLTPDEEAALAISEQNFNAEAQHYDAQFKENYYRQLEEERAYILQRNQAMETELSELKKLRENYYEEQLKTWEEKVLEGVKIASARGESENTVVLMRELARIDRLREKMKEQSEQQTVPAHPLQAQPQYGIPQQGYVPQPQQQQYGMPQQTYGYPPQQPQQYGQQQFQPQYGQPQQQTQPYQHPLANQTPTTLPSKPHSGATSTAAPTGKGRIVGDKKSSRGKIHPAALALLETHQRPPGMSLEDYYEFYLDRNKNIKE